MDSADPPPVTAPPQRGARTGMRNLILLALLTFVAGAAITIGVIRQYSAWLAMPSQASLPTAAPPAATAGEAAFQPPVEPGERAAPVPPDPAVIDARQMSIEGQLTALEGRLAAVDRDSRMAAGNAARAESLLIAFAARRAIDRGLSLGYLEDQLRQRFGQVQPRAVATIIAAAHNPVTIEELRLGLDTLAPDLATGTTTDGWWAGLRRELGSLIVIRKEGTPSPRPADRLERVRRLVDAGQVEIAMAEVARLPGARQASGWNDAAARYVEAHRALDLIEMTALQTSSGMTLAPAPAPAPTR